jgi:hypothetical protein
MDFRTRLLSTLRAIAPVLREPGVMVAGSEVPNLLEPGARSSLVVSQDVDVVVPVGRHSGVKERLHELRDLSPSAEEPSVWLPARDDLIEVNFIGVDPRGHGAGTYVLDDPELPLLVFEHLSLLRPGAPVRIDDLSVPVPRPAGLILEKLLTDRNGEKGDRDLLVALATLLACAPEDMGELESQYLSLSDELRFTVRSGLATLSLVEPRARMLDPTPHRPLLALLMGRLESLEAPR